MFDKISDYIRRRVFIPEADLHKAFDFGEVRRYKKGDYFLRVGEYCRHVGFMNAGLMVSTFVGETGKEIACHFFVESDFFTYVESLKDAIPSHKNFIALEDCEVLLIAKTDLPRIFSIHPGFEALYGQVILESLQRMVLAEQEKRTQSVEERYLRLMETALLDRAPLKYIAGYLGVEPPSLSRLRKRLASQRKLTGVKSTLAPHP